MTAARGHDGTDWITLWKGQAMTADAPTIDRIRHRADRLASATRRRNRREYAAGAAAALVLAAAGAAQLIAATGPADLLRAVGFLWLVGAALVSAVVLRRQSGRDRAGDLAQDSLGYLRARLRRERDLLRTAWRWYVLPTVPGFAMVYGSEALRPEPAWAFVGIAGGLTLAFLVAVAVLNLRTARDLDRQLSDLPEPDGQ